MSPEKAVGLFDDRPLMTMRVSRDSGKTWEPEQTVSTADDLQPLITLAWPPCQCTLCTRLGKS